MLICGRSLLPVEDFGLPVLCAIGFLRRLEHNKEPRQDLF
jgi:hypothetical protein